MKVFKFQTVLNSIHQFYSIRSYFTHIHIYLSSYGTQGPDLGNLKKLILLIMSS